MIATSNSRVLKSQKQRSEEFGAVVREIASRFSPERVILFGSRANGTATADSDADLLVVMDHEAHPALKAAEIRRTLRAPFGIDLIVRSKRKLEERMRLGDPFISEILSSGVTLYEASRA